MHAAQIFLFLARSVSEGDHDGSLTTQQRGHLEPLYASASRSFRARVGWWSPSLTLRARERNYARRANVVPDSSPALASPVNPSAGSRFQVPGSKFQVPKFGNGPHDNRNAVEHRSPGSRSAPWVTIPKQHLHPNGVHGRVFDCRHRRLVGEADRRRRLGPFGVAWST